jgi:hypothetical protein
LLELLESKVEVEQLDLVLLIGLSSFVALPSVGISEILSGLSVPNHITRKLPCPNLKVLRLYFLGLTQQAIHSCRQMMENRTLAGYSLEKCYIWLHGQDWEDVASLVLVMENEKARIEG